MRRQSSAILEHKKMLGEELNALYFHAAKLDRVNWTKKQRRDYDWALFESLGGKPRGNQKQSYKEHLRRAHKRTRLDREDAEWERKTGEYDVRRGSALRRLRMRVKNKALAKRRRPLHEGEWPGRPHEKYHVGRFDMKKNHFKLSPKLQHHLARERSAHASLIKEASHIIHHELFDVKGHFEPPKRKK